MQTLELKIPPIALVVLVAALMGLVPWAMPAFMFEFSFRRISSVSLWIIGAIVSGLGIVSFRRARTTVNPMKPDSASSLVTSGIYRWTRNPMYLGFLGILLGWAVFLSNTSAFLFLPAFILYINRFQIEPEEKALHSVFGARFEAYTLRVRRWL